ncbi:ABC transporter ATP-binding protein [Sinorhizobium meliloti]|uniref:ABC transporter ATP-binding protein n=1 Tax=Rhizobium meliloti TaxID=382 RepID=UPI000FDB9572|nr:ABC transporter ATP-binding protein [Sinorhizobium meliloti]RVG23086.1 ABC transporter ATP-binding protein [Sinorhizobium meliloti]RVL00700.1 ABC transporter ATP-binding protein [Sinorhizobium meliloti]RVN46435.1 ABC transporter ATP-binding protein [Sinorhizobium meliloti]
MTQPILKITGLRVDSTNGVPLVDNVSLELRRGEVMGVIGESGAGKSTIGLAAMAYARAGCRITSGNIEIDGISIRDLPHEARRHMRGQRISYIAQSAAASFNPAHTILDQVTEMPVQHGLMKKEEAKRAAVELFRSLGLPDPELFGHRYPHQVSGGQLQRAMIAMAVSCRPEILVFDEPTTALDVTTQIEVLALVTKLIKELNTAALYITHDLAVVAQVASKIMVLRHGKVVEVGDTEQILSRPNDPYTAALVSERKASDRLSHDIDEPERGQTVLEVVDVVARYGDFTALKNVSLKVSRGETMAVVGESGSGKSSLARLIVGLLERSSGRVDFRGSSLSPPYTARSKDELRKVQLIYQLPDVALNPRQTIREIIGRPYRFYFDRPEHEVKDRVAELLRQVGLPAEYADRFPTALSGGQKQRVCIARALAASPELIICDEPTSALDQLVAEDILNLLKKLQDDLGLSYLFITHDLGIVRRIAHRTAVMLGGSVVQEGPTSEIFSPPFHPYTAKLISSVPELRTDWLTETLSCRDVGRASLNVRLTLPLEE